jgi:hypothetical protein
MSKIEEAIEKLEKIIDRHVCLPRREELNEVICLLREELALRQMAAGSKKTSDDEDKSK